MPAGRWIRRRIGRHDSGKASGWPARRSGRKNRTGWIAGRLVSLEGLTGRMASAMAYEQERLEG